MELPQEKIKTSNSQIEETDGGGSPSSQGMHEYSGVHVSHFLYDSVGTVAHGNIPKFILDAVGWSFNVSEDIYSRDGETVDMVVDSDLQPKTLSPNYSPSARDNYIRCQSRRMWSPLPGPFGSGTLALQTIGVVSNILELRAAFQSLS